MCRDKVCLKLVEVLVRTYVFFRWCKVPVDLTPYRRQLRLEYIDRKIEQVVENRPYSPDELKALVKEICSAAKFLYANAEPGETACLCRPLLAFDPHRLFVEYCKSNPKVRVMVVYPLAFKQRKMVEQYAERYGTICHRAEIPVTTRMLKNLVWLFYHRDERMGLLPEKSAFWPDKVRKTSTHDRPMTVYIFEPRDVDSIREMKEKIRAAAHNGFHSVHINDRPAETVQMARCLLHPPSLERYKKKLYSVKKGPMKLFNGFLTAHLKLDYDLQDGLLLDLTSFHPDSFPEYEVASSFSGYEKDFTNTFRRAPRKERKFTDAQIYDGKFFYWFGMKVVF